MNNGVTLKKVGIIESCIKRIHEEYDQNPKNLENDSKNDSIVLNLKQACQASIDLAIHIVTKEKLGFPKKGKEAFLLLEEEGIIPSSLSQKMQAMVEYSDLLLYDDQKSDLKMLQMIIETYLVDFIQFSRTVLIYFK